MADLFPRIVASGPNDRYVQFSCLGGKLRVLRCPVSMIPEDGTLGFVDNGTERARGPRGMGGRFKDGRWVRLSGADLGFEPTYWSAFDA